MPDIGRGRHPRDQVVEYPRPGQPLC